MMVVTKTKVLQFNQEEYNLITEFCEALSDIYESSDYSMGMDDIVLDIGCKRKNFDDFVIMVK